MNSDTDERLIEIVELASLYDMYGELLKEHNRQIFEDYVLNNYSLSEIAEEAGISRQGVRDIVVRCSGKLKEFEEKLHLNDKIRFTVDALDELEKALESDTIDRIAMLAKVKALKERLEI